MKNLIPFLVTILSITVLSCARMEKAEDPAGELEAAGQVSAQVTQLPGNDLYSNGQTKIIKTVNYRFEVDNVKKSTEAIESALKKYPAYISSSNLYLQNPILENKISIRVQSEY